MTKSSLQLGRVVLALCVSAGAAALGGCGARESFGIPDAKITCLESHDGGCRSGTPEGYFDAVVIPSLRCSEGFEAASTYYNPRDSVAAFGTADPDCGGGSCVGRVNHWLYQSHWEETPSKAVKLPEGDYAMLVSLELDTYSPKSCVEFSVPSAVGTLRVDQWDNYD